jgi:hypothetical protein
MCSVPQFWFSSKETYLPFRPFPYKMPLTSKKEEEKMIAEYSTGYE